MISVKNDFNISMRHKIYFHTYVYKGQLAVLVLITGYARVVLLLACGGILSHVALFCGKEILLIL